MNASLLSYEAERAISEKELARLKASYTGTPVSALALAYEVAHKYSTCYLCGVGKGVGTIIIKDGLIVSFGFNGVSRYTKPCKKETCIRVAQNIPDHQLRDMCFGDCSEKKAVANASRLGTSLVGSTAYITKSPCVSCTKLLADIGVRNIVYHKEYSNSAFTFELMRMAGIHWLQI